MLILSAEDVASLLDLDRLVDSLEVAMTDVSAGRLSMPARTAAYVAERHGLLGVMPAHLPAAKALVCKLVSVFPDNRDVASHQAVICCFDSSNGTPVAVMDGTHVTAVRTAAGSALATRLLARADARVVTVIGAGVQAAAHGRALSRLPGVELILLAGRDRHRVRTLAAQLAADGVNATASDTIESAVREADVVCATTHAAEPVLSRAWLRPGTHVNSVGYNVTGAGEIDQDTVNDSLVVVESRAVALAPPPAGAVELRAALETGTLRAEDTAEIGEIAAGTRRGRTDESQLTLYKSVGVAAQDAAAAALVLDAARERGIGQEVHLEAPRRPRSA